MPGCGGCHGGKTGAPAEMSTGGHERLVSSQWVRHYPCEYCHAGTVAAGGDLAAGKLEGTIITCPRHTSQFDITDGHNIRWMKGSGLAAAMGKIIKSPRPVLTYKVKIEGDAILVEV